MMPGLIRKPQLRGMAEHAGLIADSWCWSAMLPRAAAMTLRLALKQRRRLSQKEWFLRRRPLLMDVFFPNDKWNRHWEFLRAE